jgi:alpha-glucan,water dikinase
MLPVIGIHSIRCPDNRPILVTCCCIRLDRYAACAQVVVTQNEDGSQTIDLTSNIQAGRLLLHWGVEGGPNYKGGWRLPGEACRPEGSVQYKDRALQSPFK